MNQPFKSSAARPIYGAAPPEANIDEVAFMNAALALRDAAMALDPTIKGMWIGKGEAGELTQLVFDRSGVALDHARRMRDRQAA